MKPMVALASVLLATLLATQACAADPRAAELQAILADGELDDIQEVSLTLRRLGLRTRSDVELLDVAETLELAEHLKAAEISLGDRARLRRMTEREYTGDAVALIDCTNEKDKAEVHQRRAQAEKSQNDSSTLSMDTAALMVTAFLGCASFIVQARVAKAADLNQKEVEQNQALHGLRQKRSRLLAICQAHSHQCVAMIAEKDRARAAMQLERVRNQVAEALMPMGANISTALMTQVLIGANPLLLITNVTRGIPTRNHVN